MLRLARGLACIAMLVAAAAHGQVLYKWTDVQGKVQYSDQPPKNFSGVVTRIEPDVQPPAGAPPAATKPAAPQAAAQPGEDSLAVMAARRRELRERLSANVERARARVEAAQKALDEAKAAPADDERQIIQQRVAGPGNRRAPQGLPNPDPTQAATAGGGMHGMSGRANCRTVKDAAGKSSIICPSSVLKPEYFERIARLEEELRAAEAELEKAQETYRRNVD